MHERLAQRLAEGDVARAVIVFANAFDTQDWDGLRSALGDPLWTDYSEFRKEPPGFVSADAYVESRRAGLAGLRSVHALSNIQVSLSGPRATCRSIYQIHRVNPDLPPHENHLFTTGTYEHGLECVGGRWLIHRIRQTVVLQSGNPDVHGAFR